MKTTVKLLVCIVLALAIISTVFTYSVSAKVSISNLEGQARNFVSTGKSSAGSVNIDEPLSELEGFGQILTTVGAGILVAVTAYMGIKYITATPETQGKLKQQLIGLVVAAFVIFGSYSIWKIVLKVVQMFDN